MIPVVLVIDDDTATRHLIETILTEEANCRVFTASDGLTALNMLDEIKPDLILVDYYMPLIDSQTFVTEYRRRPGPHAPIVVVTAAAEAAQRAAEVAAEGFLRKPFELDELLELVQQFTDPARPETAN